MPAPRLLQLLALVTLILIGGLLYPPLLAIGVVADLLLLGAAVIDLRRARALPLAAVRQWPPLLVQGAPAEVVVSVRQRSRRTVVVSLREASSPALTEGPRRERLQLPPRGEGHWRLALRPRFRGEHLTGPLTARVLGPWGLAWSQRELVAGERVRIFPQIRWEGRVGQLLMLAQRRRMGQVALRMQGVGSEPYALREYLTGDPLAKIHWKSTARHGRLVSREDSWERGTPLVLLLDTARSMAGLAGERSKLDAALAAALALTRVAAARGDEVTLIAFAERVERVVRVRAGGRGIQRAYAQLFDLEARLTEPAYDVAVEAARTLEPRRALAVMFTSVVDLVAAELLRESLLRLGGGHSSLLVNLEDPELRRLTEEEPGDVAGAFAQVAALDIVQANRRLASHLRRGGVKVVTSSADRLALATLEAYLAHYRGRVATSTRAALRG